MSTRYFKPAADDPEIGNIIVNLIESIGMAPAAPLESQDMGDRLKGYDVLEFIDDVYDFLKGFQKKTKQFKDFTFVPESTYIIPSEDESNALRYKILSRDYLTTDRGVRQSQANWMLRDIVEDKENPGYKVLMYQKLFVNEIEFTSWSKNYRDANMFAFQLEELFESYRGIFKMKGLLDLRYLGRGEDMFREKSNYGWHGCPLTYFTKTNKIKMVYEKVLEDVAIEVLSLKT